MGKFILMTFWVISFVISNIAAKKLVGIWPGLSVGLLDCIKTVLLSGWAWAMVVGYGCCALLYLALLKQFPLSVLAPTIAAVGIVSILFASKFFLGESIKSMQWIGVILLIGGVVLVQPK